MTMQGSTIVSLLLKHGILSTQELATATLVASKVERQSDKTSHRYHVAVDGVTKFTVKFLPKSWEFSPEDIVATMSRYAQFTSVNVPKLVKHIQAENGAYFVEEFLESAVPLDELVERGSVGASQALELVRAILIEVYGSGRKPTKDILESEKAAILASMKNLVREGMWGDFILHYVSTAIDAHAMYLREVYTSGDIIDRNIVLSNGRWYLVDYEYSHRTVFGFIDAFRNILYTRWARNYTLADLYPPLKNFPPDVAAMISVAAEYAFQSGVLDDESAEVTRKHLRYVFWNALDPAIIGQLDKRLAVAEDLEKQKEIEIMQIRTELSRLHVELSTKDHDIRDLEVRAMELLKEIDVRDRRIGELSHESEVHRKRVAELTNWSDDLQHQIRVQGDKLNIQEKKLEETGSRLHAAVHQLAEKTRLYDQQVSDYIYIKSTFSYSVGRIVTLPFVILFKIFVRLYKRTDAAFGSRLWPRGSKRAMIMNAVEHLPDTIATGTYLLRMHGFPGLFNGIRDTWNAGTNLGILRGRHVPHTAATATVPPPPARPARKAIQPLARKDVPVIAETGISVVIPALNEADNLALLLPSLLGQKGFTAIEIIVVDSGSTDDTVELASEYGAKVIQIPLQEFSHSGTRNLGIEHATQAYVLTMTQDALPTSDTWLYQMYSFMKKEGLAAVSCREVPRADVDLFSRVQMWNHYTKFLELASEDKVLTLPKSRDPLTLRKHAQLTDVACLMRRDLFAKYRYRYEYGEDLDLGLRLIGDNLKIGIMSSVSVIHSHRRPPYYHLKRAYVDKLVLGKILNEPAGDRLESANIISDILVTWDILSPLTAKMLLDNHDYQSLPELRRRINEVIGADKGIQNAREDDLHHHPFIDRRFADFLLKLRSFAEGNSGRNAKRHILAGLKHFLAIAFEYMEQTYERVDEHVAKDVVDLLYKQFAVLCGAYLASCVNFDGGKDPAMEFVKKEFGDPRTLLEEKREVGRNVSV